MGSIPGIQCPEGRPPVRSTEACTASVTSSNSLSSAVSARVWSQSHGTCLVYNLKQEPAIGRGAGADREFQ